MGGKQTSLSVTLFFLIFYCLASTATSMDTIKQGNMLNSSTFLVSVDNKFTLGFFSPGNSSSSYLGIWYTNILDPHPVWVGNRNTPIYNNSGVLSIDDTGKLIITHNGGDPIELYKGQTHTQILATLLDSGNFILKEMNSERVLWESFDYPTDSLLLGMKLGVHHRTGQNWSLTSWFGENLPASGAFTLDWDSRIRRLIVRRRGVIYWMSGDLSNHNYNLINFTNEDEAYFTYSLKRDPIFPPKYGRWISSRWRLGYQGDIYGQDYLTKVSGYIASEIAELDLCYGYNTNGGCELWEQPTCRNHHQKFDLRSGIFRNFGEGYGNLGNFDEGSLLYDNSSLSYSDCRAKCWNDCDCIGFKNDGDNTCLIWRGKNLSFKQDLSGRTIQRHVLISEPSNKSKFAKSHFKSNYCEINPSTVNIKRK